MKIFRCDGCEQTVFFESVRCTRCGHTLAFLPDRAVVAALERHGGNGKESSWRPLSSDSGGGPYRMCRNSLDYAVCNWAVGVNDENQYCVSCRLNHLIPNLAGGHVEEWHRMELAKRRLIYTLLGLGLPLETKAENPARGLAFDFLEDGGDGKVFTGHSEGLITINIAEADNPFREKMREQLGETYRTLLGHFRHESGHYYWERLVEGSSELDAFRQVFGDERASYDEACKRHYKDGPPPNWWEKFVSGYASMHPWEDWAETWAHYLHMVDGLETARAYGLSLRPTASGGAPEPSLAVRRLDIHSFDDLIEGWIPLTLALNSMNRSFGTNDCYPFVLTPAAIDKLRFVHGVVEKQGRTETTPVNRPAAA
jgi:hypothetical protein